jgi:hypothetical protein
MSKQNPNFQSQQQQQPHYHSNVTTGSADPYSASPHYPPPYYPGAGSGGFGDPYYQPQTHPHPPPPIRPYGGAGGEEQYQDYSVYYPPPPNSSQPRQPQPRRGGGGGGGGGRGQSGYGNAPSGGRGDYPDFSNSYYPPHHRPPHAHAPHHNPYPPPQHPHYQPQQQQPGYYDPSPYYPPATEAAPVDENAMVYEVRFKCTKDTYRLDPQCQQEVHIGDTVVVETDRGYDAGTITAIQPADIPMASMYSNAMSSLRCIVSVCSEEELATIQHNRMEEDRALQLCRHLALMRHLPMVVAATEMQFDRRKLTIIFSADRRVDFRELVRDMFQVFKTRIWMQKVSPAEAAALSVLFPTSPLPPQGIPIPQTRSLVSLPNLSAESSSVTAAAAIAAAQQAVESYPIYEPIDERGAPPHRQKFTNDHYSDHSQGPSHHHRHHQAAMGGYGDHTGSSSPRDAAAAADRYYDSDYPTEYPSDYSSSSAYPAATAAGHSTPASLEQGSDYSYPSSSHSPNSEIHQLTGSPAPTAGGRGMAMSPPRSGVGAATPGASQYHHSTEFEMGTSDLTKRPSPVCDSPPAAGASTDDFPEPPF